MFQSSPVLERFIVIEGIDGAGTSTQRTMLCKAMISQGFSVHETWEPSPGPIGLLIRKALKKDLTLGSATLARLFAADRGEHCFGPQGIVERCKGGQYVVSDRYSFSSFAYQGMAHSLDWIAELNAGFPLPHDLFFVDVDLETSKNRRLARGEEPELFDEDPVQLAVRSNYHQIFNTLATERPDVRLHYMDGSMDRETLHKEIWRLLGFPPILEG